MVDGDEGSAGKAAAGEDAGDDDAGDGAGSQADPTAPDPPRGAAPEAPDGLVAEARAEADEEDPVDPTVPDPEAARDDEPTEADGASEGPAPAASEEEDEGPPTFRPRSGGTEILPKAQAAVEPAEPRALVGTTIAERYRLLEVIGEGGMGAVYRAEHVGMRKTVAVKVLHPELTTVEDVVRRFEREARAAANIDHPNVCAATDFGRAESGSFYLVMEYLEGETLDQVLGDHGSLPVRRAIRVVVQICQALERAHGMGIVHRDLKPENVVLTRRDEEEDFVKVLDFGIARVPVDDHSGKTLTRAGMVIGTPAYLSPEQATGRPTDHRTDLYSLGVTLFETIAGRRPFESPSAVELLGMHATRPPPKLSRLAPAARVSPRLERLVARMLAKEPHQRPESARAVRLELEAILAEQNNPRSRFGEGARAALSRVFTLAAPAVDKLRPVPRWVWAVLVFSLAAPAAVLGVVGSWVGGDGEEVVILAPPEAEPLPAPLGGGDEVLVMRPPPPPRRTRLDAARARPEIAAALERRQEGGPDAVVRELGRLYRAEKSPELAFLLGEAEAMAGDRGDALQHAKVALDGLPEAAADPGLKAFIIDELGSGRNGWLAARLIEDHYMPGAATDLARLACAAEDVPGRRRAAAVLAGSKALDTLEPWCRLTVELGSAASCEERRDVIVRMGELGDPRALPALGQVRQGTTGALFWKRRINGCLQAELGRTKRILEAAAGHGDGGADG